MYIDARKMVAWKGILMRICIVLAPWVTAGEASSKYHTAFIRTR